MNGSLTEAMDRLGPIGLSILIQLTVVLTIALCLMCAFRRNPAARHFVGLCGLASAAFCPVLLLVAPTTRVSWLVIPLNRHIQSAQESAGGRISTPDELGHVLRLLRTALVRRSSVFLSPCLCL